MWRLCMSSYTRIYYGSVDYFPFEDIVIVDCTYPCCGLLFLFLLRPTSVSFGWSPNPLATLSDQSRFHPVLNN